jgi:hypothetical protein
MDTPSALYKETYISINHPHHFPPMTAKQLTSKHLTTPSTTNFSDISIKSSTSHPYTRKPNHSKTFSITTVHPDPDSPSTPQEQYMQLLA